MKRRSTMWLPRLLLALSAVLAAPAAAAASCGADYLTCMAGAGLVGGSSSDSLHEDQCRAGYIACVRQLFLSM